MTDTKPLITPVLIAGCVVIMISFAVRASFGVFQIPVATEFNWPRAEFSLAIAIQNLAWGIGQPIFGAIAEKIGDRKAIIMGALMYAAGLVLSSMSVTPSPIRPLESWSVSALPAPALVSSSPWLAARRVTKTARCHSQLRPPQARQGRCSARRLPLLLDFMTWQSVFLVFAVAVLASLSVLPMMRSPTISKAQMEESLGRVLVKAFKDPTFSMIFLGFFSCGYQLAFVTAHFPALVTEMCAEPTGIFNALGITSTKALGAVSISLIGLANIAGTLYAGYLGKRYSRKYLLAGIYTGRTIIAALFIMLPITPWSVVIFSVGMGSLWLATVPLTSGLVAHIYGLRYMGTLYGIVFFSHQLGSFIGVWLGGKFYDLYGSYTVVWWVGVGVGAFSALVHLPIIEKPLAARRAATQAA